MNPLLKAALKTAMNAPVSGNGNRFRDGEYELTVLTMTFDDKQNGPTFIPEFVIDSSKTDSGAIGEDGKPSGATANAAGTQASCPFVLQSSKSAGGNMKKFVCALLGVEHDQVTPDELIETVSEMTNHVAGAKNDAGEVMGVNPGRGMRVRMRTYRSQIKSGKNAGKYGLFYNWENIAQTPEQIAARRAELDKAAAGSQAA
jgi:hypothetical protein